MSFVVDSKRKDLSSPRSGWRFVDPRDRLQGAARWCNVVRISGGCRNGSARIVREAPGLLRETAAGDSASASFVVLAASDPAKIYNLALDASLRDQLSRPRGSGALLVTKGGKVALSVEGRGRRVTIADWMTRDDVEQAKELLSIHLRGEKGARYLMLPDIRSS